MNLLFFRLGAISAFLAVAAGAFGAHALQSRLAPDALAVFETGARYQMYHAVGLFVAAWVGSCRPGRIAGWCFAAGTLLFCGSLYALALTGIRPLGAITPFGGIAFLAGWVSLLFAVGQGDDE